MEGSARFATPGRTTEVRPDGGRLVERGLERLTGAEAHDAALRNLDRGARLRVARGARLTLRGLERAEADEGNRLAFLQRLGDAFEERVHGGRRVRLGDAGVLCNLRDQFLSVHEPSECKAVQWMCFGYTTHTAEGQQEKDRSGGDFVDVFNRGIEDGIASGGRLADLERLGLIDRDIGMQVLALDRIAARCEIARVGQPESTAICQAHEFLHARAPERALADEACALVAAER